MMRTRIGLTALTLGASLISFLSYTLLLKHFGASRALDLLFYAASLPVSVAAVTSGVLLYLLPPRFTGAALHVQESTLRVLWRYSAVAGALASLGALVYGLALRDWTLVSFWLGFTLVGMVSVLISLLTCIAQARGHYLLTGMASLLTSTGLLAGAAAAMLLHVEWLLLMGQVLGTAFTAWWLARSLSLTVAIQRQDAMLAMLVLTPLRRHAMAITLGTLAFTLFQPIDAALCALLDSGSVSVMAYAQRVVVAAGTAVSLGAYAVAARTAHDSLRTGGNRALGQMANREVGRVVGFGLAVWLAYLIGGQTLLNALLASSAMQGGNLTRLLSCVQWMLLGVGPMAAVPYLFRVFYAQADYRKPAILGLCIAPAYGIAAWALLPRFEILALAYAYTFVWWVALLVALLWLNQASTQDSTLQPT